MMTYDFILFENAYNIENHYKDLSIMARLLKTAGYTVAIADVFKEDKLCSIDGIPHIQVPIGRARRYNELKLYRKKKNIIQKQLQQILLDIYLFRVTRYLSRFTKNIYMGSWMMGLPLFFLHFLDKNTNYYMWGLRSATMLYWHDSIWSKGALFSYIYARIAKKKNNLFIVVSNHIIKKEFIENIGVPASRLIVRPERCVEKENKIVPLSKEELHILTIGTLRPFKHVEFALDALRILNNNKIFYTIAGRCKDDNGYEKMIEDKMIGVPNVTRINRFIPDEEYELLMKNCDVLLLCDGTQKSCASNGTMSEALLHGKPIIAPDFNPFKYEVENYNVGVLYEYQNVNSLTNVLNNMLEEGTYKYIKPLTEYQKKFLFSEVACSLREQIEKQNDKNKKK